VTSGGQQFYDLFHDGAGTLRPPMPWPSITTRRTRQHLRRNNQIVKIAELDVQAAVHAGHSSSHRRRAGVDGGKFKGGAGDVFARRDHQGRRAV